MKERSDIRGQYSLVWNVFSQGEISKIIPLVWICYENQDRFRTLYLTYIMSALRKKFKS